MNHPPLSADPAKLQELTTAVARAADRILAQPIPQFDPAALVGTETSAVVAATDVGARCRGVVAALHAWSQTAQRCADDLAAADQSTASRLGR
ncbi:hypothetical protein [Mycobacterium sp. ACS4331]|uniref:hypothetical protein n=1 Tax=Mycobacterium sp. ACS4331 TaxID=1834121 RepID=UPI0007FC69A4|nr:hypothetical protein [Mycobacterium sp. ACS4331]OBF11741.1 hypothetical protein A5727_19800 [Mycobacterium sp. ACS4331]